MSFQKPLTGLFFVPEFKRTTMIQEKANVKVEIDGEAASSKIKALTEQTKKWKQELKDIYKSNKPVDPKYLDQLKKGIRENQREVRSYKKQLTDLNYILKNLSSVSIEDLRKAQKKLKLEIQKSSRATKEDIANLKLKEAQLKKINSQLTLSSNTANKSGLSFSNMANGFNKYFTMVSAFAATIVGIMMGFRQVNQLTMEFEERADNLRAITGLAGAELAYLTDRAKETSIAILKSGVAISAGAAEIVDAYTQMGSARPELLKVKEDLADVTEKSLILAAASKTEAQPAIEAVAAAMNQYGYDASQATRIINTFAAGSLEGSSNVVNLTKSLSNVGTVASASNLNLEQTVALLEVLGAKQLKNEEAGTKLRSILVKLKAAQLGYESGTFNLRDALIEANLKLDSFGTNMEKDAYKAEIFGERAIVVGEILMNNVDEFDRLTDAVTGTNVAIEQGIINTDNQATALKQAQNRYKLTAMQLGEELGPAVVKSTNAFRYFLKFLVSGIQVYKENKDALAAVTTGLIVYGTAIKAEIIITQGFTAATWLAQKAMIAFNWAMKSNPIPFLLSAIVGLIVYMTDFTKTTKKATEEQQQLNDELERFQDLAEDIETDFFINVIYEYGDNFDDWTKTASKQQLTRMKSYLEKYIAEANRHIINLGVGDIDEKAIYEEGITEYKNYLSEISNELNKFKNSNTSSSTEAPESFILEGERNLAELEKQLKKMEELQKRMSEAKIPDNPKEDPADDVDLSYALKQYEESFAGRRALLDAYYKGGVIGHQEYTDRVKELNQEIADHEAQTLDQQKAALAEKLNFVISFAQQLSGVLQTWANVQAENERLELSNYKDMLDQKKELLQQQLDDGIISKKQYDAQMDSLNQKADKKERELANKQAKRQKTIAMFNAIISVAQAVAAAMTAGPGVGQALAIITAALGAVQVGVIASQKVPQYAQGSWDEVIGATDGKTYRAKQGSYGTQIVDGPTIIPGIGLVGEGYKPKEIIFSGEDSTRIMNSPALVEAINYTIRTPQFADGNYPGGSTTTITNQYDSSRQEALLMEMLIELRKKKKSYVAWDDIQAMNDDYDNLMDDVST